MKRSEREKKETREAAIVSLRQRLPKGSDVYVLITKVASSGMSRHMRFFIPWGVSIMELTWDVAKVLELRLSRDRSAAIVSGCGMDMAFAMVYDLSSVLLGDGYALNRVLM